MSLDVLTASAFSQPGPYASCPIYRVCCYAELAIFSLAISITIASPMLPAHGGMARLS